MRSIRTIGLAAVAALMALSAIGVASASAEAEAVLCKANEEKCKGTNYIGYAFNANATALKFNLSEAGTVQCNGAMVRDKNENVTTLSFSSCTEGCTVTAKSLPYYADMYEPSGGNGKLAMTIVGLAFKCGTSECVYSGSLEKLSVTGGAPAVISINQTLNEEAGSILCPESVLWEAEYKIKAVTSAYVTKRATGEVFCTHSEGPCGEEFSRLSPSFSLAPKAEFVISSLGGTTPVKCTEAGFTLTNVELHEPVEGWHFEPGAIGGCTASPYTNCTATMESAPYATSLKATGEGNGTISVTTMEGHTPTLSLSCKLSGTPFTCKLTVSSFTFTFLGGEPGLIPSSSISMTKQSGPNGICPTTMSVKAEYKTNESPTYITPN